MKKATNFSVLHLQQPVNRRYQLLMFDFDGTLCNTGDADIIAIQKAYHTLHKTPPTKETIYNVLGKGLIIQSLFKTFSPNASEHLIQELVHTYKVIYKKEATYTKLFPGVPTLLAQLKEAKVSMMIVSNKVQSLLEMAVKDLQIESYFDAVIGIQKNNRCKPDFMLYKEAIQPRFSTVSLKDMLMIGDTPTDLAFAASLPVEACWASYGAGHPDICLKLQPKHIIQKASDLLKVILPHLD